MVTSNKLSVSLQCIFQRNRDSFFKKYENQKVTGYLEKLYIKETKKTIFIAAEVIILGKWYCVCINNNAIAPYKLKNLTLRGQLGVPIDLKHMPIPCQAYRFMQEKQPLK